MQPFDDVPLCAPPQSSHFPTLSSLPLFPSPPPFLPFAWDTGEPGVGHLCKYLALPEEPCDLFKNSKHLWDVIKK